ncbi:DeoR/GlpR family DNA-binding transcription regulator [Amycolatopsis sp. EV170708-02-1]|uniref:DeoR/GlpR family DNA-binding transcription regulator n=1 Tax=Amycolatopsis sp. EV170708-02-1 TaxID=2919322 RepID=UPI001F0BCC7E|nr:DeoR/GlpR family DNA-binding transcription regulator [Amycolatopsis sp. EV170708-02-1]UMP07014.1 DeoR/GlpR family DNA-binding transcription regulator [Amycolatopsis sp. EV170708-02-1]
MYAEERQQVILGLARDEGRVDVTALAANFQITTETVRRDLSALERHGLLRRVHGGAIPVERLDFEPGLAAKDSVMTAEKERIAKAALAEVPPEGAILIDAGTTTARLAEVLPADRELTVVTHSLIVASTLSTRPNLTLMLVGGRVRGRTMAMVDSWALHALQETFVDVAFMATNGVSVQRGLTTPDTTEAMVKRAAVNAARRTVLLADHTKVGNDYFARFGNLSEVDTFITDTGIDAQAAAEIKAAGTRVVRA